MTKVLVTNGGAHPSSVWADITAQQLFNPDTAAADKRRAVQAFQLQVAELLDTYHADVETTEKDKLSADAAHMNTGYESHGPTAEEAVDKIIELSKGTALEAHCARPEWRPVAVQVVATQFASNAFMHRSIHADGRIDDGCEHARRFRAAQLGELSGGETTAA